MEPIVALIIALGTLATGTGTAALVRVFMVERRSVTQDDMEGYRVDNRSLRNQLGEEIENRRKDRAASDEEIRKLREEISTLRNNWDACRSECQRLRQLVEDRQ